MATTTALELNKIVHQQLGDWIEVQTTVQFTNTNTHIISTNLRQYDNGRDGVFEDWWAFVTDKGNAGEDRKIRNYYTANAVCNTYGAVWANDTVQANVRIHRFPYTEIQRSINDALRETFPTLHRAIDDRAAITTNSSLYEYQLPSYFQTGEVRQVLINSSGTTNDPAWDKVIGWDIVNAGASIRFPDLYSTGQKIRIIGVAPLETVNAVGDQVNISGEYLNLLTAYAKYKFYQQYANPASSEDIGRYERRAMDAYAEYLRLKPNLGMTRPVGTLNLKTY